MNYKLFFVALVIIVVVALASIRKAGKAAIAIAVVLVSLVGVCAVVVFAPSSGLAVWVTEKIAPTIEFDTGDIHDDGDAIFTFKVLEQGGANRKVTKLDAYADFSDIKEATKQFMEERLSALVERRLKDLKGRYVLRFKDSYMLLVPGETSFSIIKGKPPE